MKFYTVGATTRELRLQWRMIWIWFRRELEVSRIYSAFIRIRLITKCRNWGKATIIHPGRIAPMVVIIIWNAIQRYPFPCGIRNPQSTNTPAKIRFARRRWFHWRGKDLSMSRRWVCCNTSVTIDVAVYVMINVISMPEMAIVPIGRFSNVLSSAFRL